MHAESNQDQPVPGRRKKRAIFHHRYVRHERRQSYVLACLFFWSILMYFLIHQFVLSAVEVVGGSMKPNYVDGERLVVHRWLLQFRDPARHDLVVLEDPSDGGMVIKRVVGLPGEQLSLRKGRVLIDGVPLAEPFLPAGVESYPSPLGIDDYRLGPDQYFVMGDNRYFSLDSRFYGPVQRSNLTGFVLQ